VLRYQQSTDPKERDALFVRFWEASAGLRKMLIHKVLFPGAHSYLGNTPADFESMLLVKTLRGKNGNLLDKFDPCRVKKTTRDLATTICFSLGGVS
jgi:hypothetical protein